MSEDSLSLLEQAVREVEDALRGHQGGPTDAVPATTVVADGATPSEAGEAGTPAAAAPTERLAALEKEREAVRQRLHALKDRLTLIAETTPEPSDP